MANKVTFDYSKTAEYISEGEITAMKRIAEDAKKLLLSREGEGNDFLGWIDLPVVHILEPEQPMNSWDTIFIISFQSQ